MMAIISYAGFGTTRPDTPWYTTQFRTCTACFAQFSLEAKDFVKRSGSSVYWAVLNPTQVQGNCPWCGFGPITITDDTISPAGNIVDAWTYADGQGFAGVVLVDVHDTDGGWISPVVAVGVKASGAPIQAQFADATLAWAIQGMGQPVEHLKPGYAFLLAGQYTPLTREAAIILDPNMIRLLDREGVPILNAAPIGF